MISKVDDTTVAFPKVTRVEVIGNGREYTKYGVCNVWANVQDDGRTVKIFIEYDVDEEICND
jgi:hypothetical protein